MRPKSSELTNNTLAAMEMNSVNLLKWDLTRMAGFLNTCKQPSNIIAPYLDRITRSDTTPDETKFITSLKCNTLRSLIFQ